MRPVKFKADGAVATIIQGRASVLYYRKATLSGGATDDTIIIISQGGGEELILQPGQGCPLDDTTIDTWLVYNASGVGTIDGDLVFGKNGFIDNRPSGRTSIDGTVGITGTVAVVDGGKARSLAGSAYHAATSMGGVAANYPFLQLYNPAGSGKNIILEAFKVGSSTGGFISVTTSAVQLTTLAQVGQNKMLGGVQSAMQLRSQASAILTVAPFVDQFSIQANQTFRVELREPIIIGPGRGINLNHTALAADVAFGPEWFEEPV